MYLTLNSLFLLLIGFFSCNLILKKLLPFLKETIIDHPNKRSSHKLPTPTSGGISFIIISLISGLIYNNNLPFICLPLALIGLLDDL